MKELKALYDAIILAKKDVSKAGWESLTPVLKATGLALHTTHSFVYKGKLKCDGRAVTVKLPGINMDFDDVVRMVCDKPNGPVDHEVELYLTLFDPTSIIEADLTVVHNVKGEEKKDAA